MGRLSRWWWSSLPLRVIALTITGSVVVLALGGLLLMRQASGGVLDGKKRSAVAEASSAVERMQTQLRTSDLRTASLYERLNQLADEAGAQPGQYQVVIQGPVSRFVSPAIFEHSVPDSLVEAVTGNDGMYVTPTTVDWTDPTRADEPGLAIGATLQAPSSTERYPIYFIFPQSNEVRTLSLLRGAIASTSLLLLSLLGLIAWLVARHVVRSVREASVAASRIAAGNFDQRIQVRGTDDLASLGTSVNNMAAELTSQIGQLEDLSRVQQRFVQDVSHELRTPLTTVRMAADLLHDSRDEMQPFAARSTELLHHELERFESLLADLLEISRFDAGAAVLAVEETDLVPLVEREIDAQRALAESHGCSVSFEHPPTALAEVDSRRITRILRNLLTNAIEHSEGKPIELRLAMDGSVVALTVRDHGVGFSPELAEQVFHRFWRADPSRTRQVGGTGLGLAIALEDATLHGGRLAAWGSPGRGAQFHLVVPRTSGASAASNPLPVVPVEEAR
ncbi:MtrAB system histidine kinase MtrB [Luteococcus sp. Sow4_B9]|uniref:MtrAB system histidine kinase MtrB n=1 Tax=Luteococcus sp. Sow4_B9 TaxID=3438792 RepID=UPI003F99BA67